MFITSLFYNLKKLYEYLIFPSKRYSKKYSKEYSRKYVNEYLAEINTKTSPSPSLSLPSSKYAGEDNPSYDYNNYDT